MKWFRTLRRLFARSSSRHRFRQDAQRISLTTQEHSATRVAILKYITDHPLAGTEPRGWSGFRLFPAFAFAGIVMVLFGGWSAVQAAEEALPGDPLYVLKVRVVEPLRALPIVAPRSKAELSIRIAKTRLEEAERLLVEKRLTPPAVKVVSQEFRRHAQAVEEAVEALKESADLEVVASVGAAFEATLRVHGDLLHQIAQSPIDEDVQILTTEVSKQTARATEIRKKAEEKILQQNAEMVREAAKRKRAQAAQTLTEAKERLTEMPHASSVFGITANLEISQESVIQGSALLEAGAEKEAFRIFQSAALLADQARERIEAQKKLRINNIESRSEFDDTSLIEDPIEDLTNTKILKKGTKDSLLGE